MSQITQTAASPTAPDTWRHPGGVLLHLIAALLAPIFLGVTAGDVALARKAAIETINDYRARNNIDLIAIAQIVGCGLAALGSLSQSMAEDLSLSMILRLRGSAVSLNRSAEQNRRVINAPLPDDPDPIHPSWAPEFPAAAFPAAAFPAVAFPAAEASAHPEPEAFLSSTAEQQLATESRARLENPSYTPRPAPISDIPHPAPTRASPRVATPTIDLKTAEKRHQEMWAIAMANEASEIAAGIPHLPPAERATATFRAAALSSTANQLLTGGSSPPALPFGPPLPNPM
jgi:hypothetical protein